MSAPWHLTAAEMDAAWDEREARLAEAERDAALGRIAMRFVDRAGDYCDVDPAERICDEFSKAMGDEVERQFRERMQRDADSAGTKRAYHETHEPPHCPTCDCAPDSASGTLQKFAANLAAAQRPLDPEVARVLYENKEDLYMTDADQPEAAANGR